jgi:hypothetical protein
MTTLLTNIFGGAFEMVIIFGLVLDGVTFMLF